MDSINLIKALRYTVANDSDMRTLFGEDTAQAMLDSRLFLKDSFYVSKEGGQDFPALTFKISDDDPLVRGCDDNQVILELTVYNKWGNTGSATLNMRAKDRLKLLLEDEHEIINSVALTFAPPVTLKVRDVAWVSASSYDDKEQGSERMHKNICFLKLTVGD